MAEKMLCFYWDYFEFEIFFDDIITFFGKFSGNIWLKPTIWRDTMKI